MQNSSEHSSRQKYDLSGGESAHLTKVPSRSASPETPNESQADSPSKVYAILDVQDPSKCQTKSFPPPDIICLKRLTDHNIRYASANAQKVCAITTSNEFLIGEANISEDKSSDVTFSSVPNFELLDVIQVSCGLNHVAIIAAQGSNYSVFAQGSNSSGQLGIGSTTDSPSFKLVKFQDQHRFVQVECGSNFTMLLTDLSEVFAFGSNSCGQLGIQAPNALTPTLVQCLVGLPIVSLASGSNHTLALTSTGLILSAGSNSNGQLGISQCQSTNQFTAIDSLSNVIFSRIEAYSNYSAAIDENGTLYLWGGDYGPTPKAILLETKEKFVEVAIGSEGRYAGLTSQNKLYVNGYYCGSYKSIMPIEVRSRSCTFFKVASGGNFFVAMASKSPPTEETRSVLPVAKAIPSETFRPPNRLSSLSISHFPSFINNPSAPQLIRYVFSSLGAINGSFLLDSARESTSDISSGIDIASTITIYDGLPLVLLNSLSRTFSHLLLSVADHPPSIIRPSTLRFIIIALLHPSISVFKESYDFWQNLVSAITRLNRSSVLKQWLSRFDSNQIRRVVDSIEAFLSVAVFNSSLYSPSVISTVEILETIYLASNRSKLLSFDAFYNGEINRTIIIPTEYEFYNKDDSWCYTRKAPWILNAETKTKFVAYNSNMLMKQQQISTINSGEASSAADLFLIFRVRRQSLLNDAFMQIADLRNPEIDLKKPLKVVFKGEPGVDEGGVQREFFQEIVKELFVNTNAFFTVSNDFYWFNSESNDPTSAQAYRLTGVIIGLALYNGNLLNVRFPSALYKKLKKMSVGLSDLEEFDPTLAKGMKSLLEYNGDVETDMGLTFEYAGVELKENGSSIPVTNSNREEYVDLVVDWLFNKSIKEQFESFCGGFMQSAGSITLTLFRPEELALLITGREELDFVALEKVTRYEGYDPSSPTVRAFWKIVHNELDDEQKKKLLFFVTSSPRAPIGGLGTVPFVIARDGDSTHIPTSHTCFFMLVLPDEPNEARLLKKLLIALDNSEGFQFQ